MNNCSVKIKQDKNGETYAKVQRYKGEEKISDFKLRIGSEMIVQSITGRKIKHQDRKIQVVGFNKDNRYGLRVNVKFLDNNRRGIIEVSDLDTF